MQNNICYLQSCNYQAKHPTLFGMAPKYEQRLTSASGGETRTPHNANKYFKYLLYFVLLHLLLLTLS